MTADTIKRISCNPFFINVIGSSEILEEKFFTTIIRKAVFNKSKTVVTFEKLKKYILYQQKPAMERFRNHINYHKYSVKLWTIPRIASSTLTSTHWWWGATISSIMLLINWRLTSHLFENSLYHYSRGHILSIKIKYFLKCIVISVVFLKVTLHWSMRSGIVQVALSK